MFVNWAAGKIHERKRIPGLCIVTATCDVKPGQLVGADSLC